MKYMRYIVIIFSFLMSISAIAQKPKCKKFKDGDFTYFDPQLPDYEVEMSRNGNVQTEFNPFFQGKVISKVVWKSDCEYELIYEKFEGFLFSMDDSIGDSVHCRILETYGKDAYKVHAKSNAKDPGRIIMITRVGATPPKP